MKSAIIHSVCECQARLSAEIDEERQVLHGWARDRRRGKQEVAPAHLVGEQGERFDVAWACPFCIRNQLRSFDVGGLSYTESAAEAPAAP